MNRFISCWIAYASLLCGFAHAGGVLPSHFDWREQLGGLSPVRNQGQCGSCWAVASTAAMEALIKIRTGQDVQLSVQDVLSCNSQGYSCSGGSFPFEYAVNRGFALESEFPYVGQDVVCQSVKSAFRATGCAMVAANGTPTVDALKHAVYEHGLVMATIYAGEGMRQYKTGILSQCENKPVNKMVNLVGWDDAGGYWIVRNTWGEQWGEQGYFRVPFGCNQIGADAAYFEYEKP